MDNGKTALTLTMLVSIILVILAIFFKKVTDGLTERLAQNTEDVVKLSLTNKRHQPGHKARESKERGSSSVLRSQIDDVKVSRKGKTSSHTKHVLSRKGKRKKHNTHKSNSSQSSDQESSEESCYPSQRGNVTNQKDKEFLVKGKRDDKYSTSLSDDILKEEAVEREMSQSSRDSDEVVNPFE